MGAWGVGIFDDDLAEDVRTSFEERIDAGVKPAKAAERVQREFAELREDPDEWAVLVLALASLLHTAGVGDHPLVDEARAILTEGRGLIRWEEAGEPEFSERKEVYAELARRLETPPEAVKRKRVTLPKVGDILEIPLADGRFAYAQYVFADPKTGPLIQVFDRIMDRQVPPEELDGVGPLFPPVVTGIGAAVRSGDWRIVGRRPVLDFKYQCFRVGNPDETGKVHLWWIWDGAEERPVGPVLPEQYRNLEIRMIWGYLDLADRIQTGHSPYIDRIH